MLLPQRTRSDQTSPLLTFRLKELDLTKKRLTVHEMYINLPCRVELLFFAVSLNVCLCLKSSPMVDFWQEFQQNDGRKSKGSPFFSNKYLKNTFDSP